MNRVFNIINFVKQIDETYAKNLTKYFEKDVPHTLYFTTHLNDGTKVLFLRVPDITGRKGILDRDCVKRFILPHVMTAAQQLPPVYKRWG